MHGARSVQAEVADAPDAGLAVDWVEETTLPFPVEGAAMLEGQLQVDPLELLTASALDAEQHGAVLVQDVVAHAVSGSGPVTVSTDAGEVRAKKVVVATNLPSLDRGPLRSSRAANGPTPWPTGHRSRPSTGCT
ncbi:MAG: FAD-dependent oxidoreductase [Propionibacteriales bacterium]|nr:FAD-dependent oxidoreductase [Propionibacteriales bacterium]